MGTMEARVLSFFLMLGIVTALIIVCMPDDDDVFR